MLVALFASLFTIFIAFSVVVYHCLELQILTINLTMNR